MTDMTTTRTTSDDEINCCMCGTSKEELKKEDKKAVSGPNGILICESCNKLVYEIINEQAKSNSSTKDIDIESIAFPSKIEEHLNKFVIDQDVAKKDLSVAVYNHLIRVAMMSQEESFVPDKSNIILIGGTGSGKTLLAKTIAKYLDIPNVIVDATNLTEAGYVGEDVETIIQKLYKNANEDVNATERGIVFIDEIDKLKTKSSSANVTAEVGGQGVQQALLKLIEGTKCSFPPNGGRKNPQEPMIEVDT